MAPVRMGSIAAQRRTAVRAQAASPGGKEVVIIGQGWAGEVVDCSVGMHHLRLEQPSLTSQ